MLLSDKIRDIIKDELLYIFRSEGLSGGKSAFRSRKYAGMEFHLSVCQGLKLAIRKRKEGRLWCSLLSNSSKRELWVINYTVFHL